MSLSIKYMLRSFHSLFSVYWYYMERLADWVVGAGKKSEYVRTGKCISCGKCCRLLAMEAPNYILKNKFLLKTVKIWHDKILNFEFQGASGNWLIYHCRYLDDANRCRIYHLRHKLCRFYPRQGLFGRPKLHDGCGFSFVSPNFHPRGGK